jgi:hypothetical protein
MTKAELSAPHRWLGERCQHINFGSISFQVRRGEPDLGQPHSMVRTLKIAGDANGSRPKSPVTTSSCGTSTSRCSSS